MNPLGRVVVMMVLLSGLVRGEDVRPGPAKELLALEWILGSWEHESEGAMLTMTGEWSEDRRFLLRRFELKLGTSLEVTIRQTIFWDPVGKKLRSWGFSSDGSYEEGEWKVVGKRVEVHRTITYADGVRGSAVNGWEWGGGKSCIFTSTKRKIRGKVGPDLAPTELGRK